MRTTAAAWAYLQACITARDRAKEECDNAIQKLAASAIEDLPVGASAKTVKYMGRELLRREDYLRLAATQYLCTLNHDDLVSTAVDLIVGENRPSFPQSLIVVEGGVAREVTAPGDFQSHVEIWDWDNADDGDISDLESLIAQFESMPNWMKKEIDSAGDVQSVRDRLNNLVASEGE